MATQYNFADTLENIQDVLTAITGRIEIIIDNLNADASYLLAEYMSAEPYESDVDQLARELNEFLDFVESNAEKVDSISEVDSSLSELIAICNRMDQDEFIRNLFDQDIATIHSMGELLSDVLQELS